MADIQLFTTDHGQKLRARTYYSDISSANILKLKFKKLGSSTTAELSASTVSGDTTYYAIEADITDGWLDEKAGLWIGQAEATFSNAVLTSKPFIMKVKAVPTA